MHIRREYHRPRPAAPASRSSPVAPAPDHEDVGAHVHGKDNRAAGGELKNHASRHVVEHARVWPHLHRRELALGARLRFPLVTGTRGARLVPVELALPAVRVGPGRARHQLLAVTAHRDRAGRAQPARGVHVLALRLRVVLPPALHRAAPAVERGGVEGARLLLGLHRPRGPVLEPQPHVPRVHQAHGEQVVHLEPGGVLLDHGQQLVRRHAELPQPVLVPKRQPVASAQQRPEPPGPRQAPRAVALGLGHGERQLVRVAPQRVHPRQVAPGPVPHDDLAQQAVPAVQHEQRAVARAGHVQLALEQRLRPEPVAPPPRAAPDEHAQARPVLVQVQVHQEALVAQGPEHVLPPAHPPRGRRAQLALHCPRPRALKRRDRVPALDPVTQRAHQRVCLRHGARAVRAHLHHPARLVVARRVPGVRLRLAVQPRHHQPLRVHARPLRDAPAAPLDIARLVALELALRRPALPAHHVPGWQRLARLALLPQHRGALLRRLAHPAHLRLHLVARPVARRVRDHPFHPPRLEHARPARIRGRYVRPALPQAAGVVLHRQAVRHVLGVLGQQGRVARLAADRAPRAEVLVVPRRAQEVRPAVDRQRPDKRAPPRQPRVGVRGLAARDAPRKVQPEAEITVGDHARLALPPAHRLAYPAAREPPLALDAVLAVRGVPGRAHAARRPARPQRVVAEVRRTVRARQPRARRQAAARREAPAHRVVVPRARPQHRQGPAHRARLAHPVPVGRLVRQVVPVGARLERLAHRVRVVEAPPAILPGSARLVRLAELARVGTGLGPQAHARDVLLPAAAPGLDARHAPRQQGIKRRVAPARRARSIRARRTHRRADRALQVVRRVARPRYVAPHRTRRAA